ncbi:MAG: DUF1549 domain-containing protein [Opitutus sp.]
MVPRLRFCLLWAVVVSLALGSTGLAVLSPELATQLPAPDSRPIDFVSDIQPIFEASCVQCHARGKAKGSFSLETRADFLIGGDTGAPATEGRSAESLVVELISGLNPDLIMPQKGKKLTPEQVGIFRAWIDQGMSWPEAITFFKSEPANLLPAAFAAPPAEPGFENPIDGFVARTFVRNQIPWAEAVDDRTYARRVWLDTIGLLPPPGELEAFLSDRAPGKRARLVKRVLADNQRYAEHWLTFWNDMLRNDYKGPGYTDGGRKQITSWVYTALAQNLPYDQFVAQLLNPGAAAEGFTKGILWRGAVNASMVTPMQASQGIAQVFLGVNLKCASCHDSFINDYTLDDSYGLASIYADGPLEIAECDKPTGHLAKVKFLYGELGEIDGTAGPAARKRQLVDIITGRQNGRLPRTIVNRLWQRFFGHGLVEPVDEMDRPAWSPALMDWLAEDLVAHGYDLKHAIARILTSRAYQLPSVSLGENKEDYVFHGPAVRRLSAEQFSDAIYSLTRQSYGKLAGKLNRLASLAPVRDFSNLLEPKWIWGAAGAQDKAPPATMVFNRLITLDADPSAAHFAICGDDNYTIKINGKSAGASGNRNSTYPDWIDVSRHLRAGENAIEITVANLPPDNGRLVSVEFDELPEADSPAGLILYARVRAGGDARDFVSDRSWTVGTYAKPPTNDRFDDSGPGDLLDLGAATELGGVELAPWGLGAYFLALAAAPEDTLPVERASLVNADSLMIALGRPNREQCITVRQATATTLQALELTNGATLARLLRAGAENILDGGNSATGALVDSLYRMALGRPPADMERQLSESLVGTPARREGIEDLLWILAMLPEFQLIH